MARDKSGLKSGMGNSMRNYLKLVEAVEDLGGGDDQLRRIETDAKLRRELAVLIIGQSTNGAGLGDTYTVPLDYSKTLEEMIAAGRYDWKNGDINAKNFKIEGSGSETVEIILRHYNKSMSTDPVLADLDKDGLRPIRIEELLALGADPKTRDLQRQFPIIALGSVWRNLGGYRFCPDLGRHGSGRRLDLHCVGYDWRGFCRFGAVRKTSTTS